MHSERELANASLPLKFCSLLISPLNEQKYWIPFRGSFHRATLCSFDQHQAFNVQLQNESVFVSVQYTPCSQRKDNNFYHVKVNAFIRFIIRVAFISCKSLCKSCYLPGEDVFLEVLLCNLSLVR